MKIKTLLIALCCLLAAFPAWAADLGYTTRKDIHYRDGGDAYMAERCVLDVYYPKDAGKPCPVVVFFHGGGLTGGSKYVPTELLERGIVVVTANYRFINKTAGGIADCIDDAAAAVAWTMANVADYNGDTSYVYVSGHSAGAYLTYMIGLDKKYLAKYGVDADSLKGLFPVSGQVITHFARRSQQGLGELQPTIDEFAPLFIMRADCPPMYIISADREQEMNGRYEETAYFWRMMKLLGHPAMHMYELDGFDHGGVIHPACTLMANIINKEFNKK